jgi:hypothetical protein
MRKFDHKKNPILGFRVSPNECDFYRKKIEKILKSENANRPHMKKLTKRDVFCMVLDAGLDVWTHDRR